jgi:hypothetical protein
MSVLDAIANPRTANIGENILSGIQASENIMNSQQRRGLLEQEALQQSNATNMKTFVSGVALALTMPEGPNRIKIIQNSLAKAPKDSNEAMALQQALNGTPEDREKTLASIVNNAARMGIIGSEAPAKDSRTPDIKNFEYAKSQGFPGSFPDYQQTGKTGTDGRTAEIKNFEYGKANPDFAKAQEKADKNKLTKHELTLAAMLASGEIDASQLPKRGNTYNKILSGAKEINPELDVRTDTADFALSKNPTFRQKAMTAEVLPDIMKHIVAAGKKVNFSNVKKFGGLQRFYKENVNDPDLVEYMALRNDGLMEIASVMRGAGMTDKAHEAEVEAMHPTMSPRALDAWAKAQETALAPRLKIIRNILNRKANGTGQTTGRQQQGQAGQQGLDAQQNQVLNFDSQGNLL